jgi:hypothetical protein
VDVSTVVPVLSDGHFVHAANVTTLGEHVRQGEAEPG